MLPFALENAQPFRIVSQVSDGVSRFSPMIGSGEVVEAPINHFHRNRCKRLVELFSHRIGQINQDRIQQPGSPQLKLDAILRADPEVSQAQQPFDNVIGVFNSPALPIQGDHIGCWQALCIQFIGQIAIPLAFVQHLDETDQLTIIILTNPDQSFMDLSRSLQMALDLICQVLLWRE